MTLTTDYRSAAAALGLAPSGRLARCTTRGCPVRWAHGADRTCPEHETPAHIAEYLAQLDHGSDPDAELPASVVQAAPTVARRARPPR